MIAETAKRVIVVSILVMRTSQSSRSFIHQAAGGRMLTVLNSAKLKKNEASMKESKGRIIPMFISQQ